MEAKRFDEACPAFAESYRLDPKLGALFALADCEAKRGRTATALARYEEYLELYEKLPTDGKARHAERARLARAQRKLLQAEAAELVVKLPKEAAAETVVKLDGGKVAAVALGSALPVDPGEHVITTEPPGGPTTKTRVTIGKGEKKEIVADVRRAPPSYPSPAVVMPQAPPSAPQSSASPGWRPYVMWGGLGLAVVGVGAGVGLQAALPAKNAEIELELYHLQHHTDVGQPICPLEDKDPKCTILTSLLRTRSAYRQLSIASFVVGGVGAADALVSLLWRPSVRAPEQEPRAGFVVVPSLNGVMVTGSF